MRTAAVLAILWVNAVAGQQIPVMDFTGKPTAALSEPFEHLIGFREVARNRAILTAYPDPRIVFVDFAADSVRQIGRLGAGPGEYRGPRAVLANGDSSVRVVDQGGTQRVLVISPSGKVLATIPHRAANPPIPLPGWTDERGRYFFPVPPPPGKDSVSMVRWDPKTNRTDTVGKRAKVQLKPAGEGFTVIEGGRRRFVTPFPAFFRLAHWVVLSSGVVASVDADPYQMTLYQPGLLPRRTPTIAYERVPVAPHEADSIKKANRIPDQDIPKFKPAFVMGPTDDVPPIIASRSNEVWVHTSTPWHAANETYDVLDSTGHLIARARLKAHSRILGFGAGRELYVARQDPADDFWYVEQYVRP